MSVAPNPDSTSTSALPGDNAAELPISCFIIAMNEADRIPRTIASVRGLVTDIVVIDSGSTDGTQQAAEAAGARVVFNAWPGFGQQKRFGETQCTQEWIINLDADEVVSPRLADEIRALFARGAPPLPGYFMPVPIIYPGTDIPRAFARDHYCLRLYDRRVMRFADSTLFDSVDPKGATVGHLKGALHHYTVRSFDDLIEKNNERASYNATHARKKSTLALTLRVIVEFPFQFFKYYLWRTHILGGLPGFQYAMITAFYRFIRVVRMREGHKRSQAALNATQRK